MITDDGSSSIYVEGLGEHYHSHFGAIQESKHIFIDSALAQISKKDISILEFGFGTGLNALLSFEYSKTYNINLIYHTLEKYPLQKSEYEVLNYAKNTHQDIFLEMHKTEWGNLQNISNFFSLHKDNIDFRYFEISDNKYDVVFFDAFAPDVQPYLWSEELFQKIFASMNQGGVLTTYTV